MALTWEQDTPLPTPSGLVVMGQTAPHRRRARGWSMTSGEGRGQIEQDSGHSLGQAGAGVKEGQLLGVPGPQSFRSSPECPFFP